jgi:predicted nucleic acid-binding protein
MGWFGSWSEKSFGSEGILGVVKGIADTGFLVAFANSADSYHDWAVEIASQITSPLLTCEAVLAEAAFHLQSVRIVLGMLRDGLMTIAFSASEHLAQIEALALRYADRKPDFADLCLIRMSELNPRYSIVTVDRGDFRIYRRNKREMIPLLCPV